MIKISRKDIKIIIDTRTTTLISVVPKTFKDGKTIARQLLKGNALVVDVSRMESTEAIRFIDFITGVLYTTNGKFKKVGEKTYLLAPSGEILNRYVSQI